MMLFLRGEVGRRYRSKLMWRPRWSVIRAQLMVGLPIGVMYGADVLGLALSQMMIAQTGATGAAATQIVMALTSMAYMPTIGIALAGTTLVGQSIGAGDREWANRMGNVIIVMCAALMAMVAILLLVVGPWLLPLFVSSGGPSAADVVALGLVLLWPAAAYQIFDGLYCGRSFCLRGAGDTQVPALTALCLSWFLFVPLAHTLIFAPGRGLDRWPATVRPRCQGRLDRPDDLLHVVRLQHVLALAARRLAPRQTVDGALRVCLIDARAPPCL